MSEGILLIFGIVFFYICPVAGVVWWASLRRGEIRKRQLSRAGKAALWGTVIAAVLGSLVFNWLVASGAAGIDVPEEVGVVRFLGGWLMFFVISFAGLLLNLWGSVWLWSTFPSVILAERHPLIFSSKWKKGLLAGGLGILWGGILSGISLFANAAKAGELRGVDFEAGVMAVLSVGIYSAVPGFLIGNDRVAATQDQNAKSVRNRFLKIGWLIAFILLGSAWGIIASFGVTVIYAVVSALMEPIVAGVAT